MSRAAPLALLLLLAPLAGCIDTPAAETADDATLEPHAAASPAPLLVDLESVAEAAAPAATPGDWWLVPITATPEGALQAFWWTIPNGSVVEDGWARAVGTKWTDVVLEYAPIVPDGTAPNLWGMVSFRERGGELQPAAGRVLTARTSTSQSLAGSPTAEEVPVSTDPGFLSLGWEAKEGERLAFVLFARADAPIDMALAFRVMGHDPHTSEGHDDPVESAAAFVEQRNGTTARTPTLVAGRGADLQAYSRVSSTGYPIDVPYERTTRVGAIEVTETAAPVAGAPVAQLRATTVGTFDGGWANVGASAFQMGVGAARWSATAEVFGTLHEEEGVTVDAWPTLFVPGPVALYGYAYTTVVQEGAGSVSGTFTLDRVGISGLLSGWTVTQFEFGTRMVDLFGVPAEPTAESGDSLGAALLADGTLVQELPGGGRLDFVGLAPPTPDT